MPPIHNLALHKFWVYAKGNFLAAHVEWKGRKGFHELMASGPRRVGRKVWKRAARAEASQTGLWINIGSQKHTSPYYYMPARRVALNEKRLHCRAPFNPAEQNFCTSAAVGGICIKARLATFNALALQRKTNIYIRVYIYIYVCGSWAVRLHSQMYFLSDAQHFPLGIPSSPQTRALGISFLALGSPLHAPMRTSLPKLAVFLSTYSAAAAKIYTAHCSFYILVVEKSSFIFSKYGTKHSNMQTHINI